MAATSSVVSSKSISRCLSFSTQRILRSDSRSYDIVERSTLLILFSFENDLSPEQFVTTKHKNNLKIASTFGKTAWIFPCLIIWYSANKFDSSNTEGGIGKGVEVSKLKFTDSRVGIGVVKFFSRLPSPELDCRISKTTDSQFAVLWNEISP